MLKEKKYQCLNRILIYLLFISCILFLIGCSEKPSRAWEYPNYDQRNTRFYPYPSKKNDLNFKVKYSQEGQPYKVLRVYERNGKKHLIFYQNRTYYVLGSDYNIIGSMESFYPNEFYFDDNDNLFYINTLPYQNIRVNNEKFELLKEIKTRCRVDNLFPYNRNGDLKLIVGENETPTLSHKSNNRFIACYDYVTGKRDWIFYTGVWPYIQPIKDYNRDGADEIIVTSYAPANGISCNGFSDLGESYVFMFDLDGNLIWHITFNGLFIRTYCLQLKTGELIVIGSQNYYYGFTEIYKVNPLNGKILSQQKLKRSMVAEPLLCDIDKDGKENLILYSYDGCLYNFNEDLKIINKKKLFPKRTERESYILRLRFANDIDGDGNIEIGAIYSESNAVKSDYINERIELKLKKFLIISNDLDIKKEYDIDKLVDSVIVVDFDGDGYNEIILLGEKLQIWGIR